ncbi:hypothetical protein A0256_04625 [Mucilaginibacter sp. PAMC 26640]|nr:hypothetical protein A0256_04625 [Mucilaginibacter sp. PAMC 26640]
MQPFYTGQHLLEKIIPMKHIYLSALAVLCAISAIAQQQSATDDFGVFNTTTETERFTATEKHEYAKADHLLETWIDKYNKADAATKQKYKGYQPSIYYNHACYEALLGNKEKALAALEQSYTLGYNNYQSIMADTDLNSLHAEKRYQAVIARMREKSDYAYLLQHSGPYNNSIDKAWPVFSYQEASTPELEGMRKKFNLDSVSGNGDEISKLKRLMFWAHNAVRHDGNSNNPALKNGIDLIAVCQKDSRGVNCRMMATILRDAYQAEGFKARMVTCFPKDTADNDCHVINVVWANTLNKWVWMDPTFNAYVTDAKGNLLNIEEVRQRMVDGKDLVISEHVNWNGKPLSQDYYLGYYMRKNLYWLQCAVKSEWDLETSKPGKPVSQYLNLYPGTYNTLHQTKKITRGSEQYALNNPKYFWQKPVEK